MYQHIMTYSNIFSNVEYRIYRNILISVYIIWICAPKSRESLLLMVQEFAQPVDGYCMCNRWWSPDLGSISKNMTTMETHNIFFFKGFSL